VRRTARGRLGVLGGLGGLIALAAALGSMLEFAGGLAAAGAATPGPTAGAHLAGTFLMTGTVTVADNVKGERRGDTVHRTWVFTPACATGSCGMVTLLRDRAKGHDRLVLHRRAPGYYVGFSNFYRPVRCGAGIYRPGERVPFRITVRITQALISGGQAVASRVTASYRNQVRYNLTPCVAYLGHDAASYHGHVVLPVT
jgi:hypothetical protein